MSRNMIEFVIVTKDDRGYRIDPPAVLYNGDVYRVEADPFGWRVAIDVPLPVEPRVEVTD